jgi:hypothetical protein
MRFSAAWLNVLSKTVAFGAILLAVLCVEPLLMARPGSPPRVGSPEHLAWVECLNVRPAVPCSLDRRSTWDAAGLATGFVLGAGSLAALILSTFLERAKRRQRRAERVWHRRVPPAAGAAGSPRSCSFLRVFGPFAEVSAPGCQSDWRPRWPPALQKVRRRALPRNVAGPRRLVDACRARVATTKRLIRPGSGASPTQTPQTRPK